MLYVTKNWTVESDIDKLFYHHSIGLKLRMSSVQTYLEMTAMYDRFYGEGEGSQIKCHGDIICL